LPRAIQGRTAGRRRSAALVWTRPVIPPSRP
jgi:hypothetical protein